MDYRKTYRFDYVNSDNEVVSFTWALTIEEARKRLERRIAAGETRLLGCIVSNFEPMSQAEKNDRYLLRSKKEKGIVTKSVRMHIDDEQDVKEYARLGIIARGIE